MTRDPTDDRSAARVRKGGGSAESPTEILDALAVELGKLAAERNFAKEAKEDKAEPDGLSSPGGRVP